MPCYRIRQPRPGDRGRAHRSPRAQERQQLVEHAVVGVGAVDAEITVVFAGAAAVTAVPVMFLVILSQLTQGVVLSSP